MSFKRVVARCRKWDRPCHVAVASYLLCNRYYTVFLQNHCFSFTAREIFCYRMSIPGKSLSVVAVKRTLLGARRKPTCKPAASSTNCRRVVYVSCVLALLHRHWRLVWNQSSFKLHGTPRRRRWWCGRRRRPVYPSLPCHVSETSFVWWLIVAIAGMLPGQRWRFCQWRVIMENLWKILGRMNINNGIDALPILQHRSQYKHKYRKEQQISRGWIQKTEPADGRSVVDDTLWLFLGGGTTSKAWNV